IARALCLLFLPVDPAAIAGRADDDDDGDGDDPEAEPIPQALVALAPDLLVDLAKNIGHSRLLSKSLSGRRPSRTARHNIHSVIHWQTGIAPSVVSERGGSAATAISPDKAAAVTPPARRSASREASRRRARRAQGRPPPQWHRCVRPVRARPARPMGRGVSARCDPPRPRQETRRTGAPRQGRRLPEDEPAPRSSPPPAWDA